MWQQVTGKHKGESEEFNQTQCNDDKSCSKISIDNGRQLFIDDYLIAATNLIRQFHYPEYHSANPVLFANEPWEFQSNGAPYAAPFSDGVWYDEKDELFKMWYKAGGGEWGDKTNKANVTCYATSTDGVHWEKSRLDVVEGTNIVDLSLRDSNTVWLDKQEEDDSKRFKMFAMEKRFDDKGEVCWVMVLRYSADGIHWSDVIAASQSFQDRSTVFYNPFKKVWVWSIRNSAANKTRIRSYLEHIDHTEGLKMLQEAAVPGAHKKIKHWFTADPYDPRHPDKRYSHLTPQVYNHDAIAYESIILGFFNIWQGPDNETCLALNLHKRNEIVVGYCRNGFDWIRPDYNRFLAVNDKEISWNNGNIQSVAGSPLIVGDNLYFYCSGRKTNKIFWDAFMSTGVAILRRDGFASMKAGEEEGYLLTKEILFSGNYLFVNAQIGAGYLQAEMQDKGGRVVDGFEKENCKLTKLSETKTLVQWSTRPSLGELMTKEVVIKFFMKSCQLYAFWVSEWITGESGGYTAGGGPGLHSGGVDI